MPSSKIIPIKRTTKTKPDAIAVPVRAALAASAERSLGSPLLELRRVTSPTRPPMARTIRMSSPIVEDSAVVFPFTLNRDNVLGAGNPSSSPRLYPAFVMAPRECRTFRRSHTTDVRVRTLSPPLAIHLGGFSMPTAICQVDLDRGIAPARNDKQAPKLCREPLSEVLCPCSFVWINTPEHKTKASSIK